MITISTALALNYVHSVELTETSLSLLLILYLNSILGALSASIGIETLYDHLTSD